MATIWTAAQINRFAAEGEQEIAKAVKCTINRISLTGVGPTFSLPTDLFSLTRVTWRGLTIDPLPANEYHELDNITSTSIPLWYIFNQQGRNIIRLHPVPNESLALVVDDDDLWGPEIANAFIVEYYQGAGASNLLPEYIRRRLVKYYVLKSCFAIQGKGQNLKAAKKFQQRYDYYLGIFKKIYKDTFISKVHVLGGGSKNGVIGPPVLSAKYGIGVDY